MRRFLKWMAILVVVGLVAVAGYSWYTGQSLLPARLTSQQTRTLAPGAQTDIVTSTVEIRPAESVIGRVSAAGQIALSSRRYVVLEGNGIVTRVNYRIGDTVAAGDVLVALDTTDLERALRRAELNVESSKNSLAQLSEAPDANEIARAEAELLAAQENLKTVQAGPTQREIDAARASLSSAWARYNELTAPMSEAERTRLEAQLRAAEITRREAQREYDKISWQNDSGMSAQGAELQRATIEYERVKAEYEISAAGSNQSDIQSALASAQDAQRQLDDLLAKPTAADLASAQAQVASAQATLDGLKKGPSDLELQATQIQFEQALVDLEEAHANLQKAQVVAPSDGVVIQLDVQVGQRLGSGEVVAVLANTQELELPVQVAEVDIDEIRIGQPAEITIDALLGRPFQGEVARISPVSSDTTGVVNYQVTIRLTDDDLTGVRPDMTAVAEFIDSEAAAGWLVPTTALRHVNSETTVALVRNGQTTDVRVTPGAIQGEWTVVQSPALQTGDQVVGSVASYVDQDNPFRFGGPPGGGAAARGGGPPPGN
jgi:HlyD family secretion protein